MGRKYEYAEWLQFECEGVELSAELKKLGEKFGERAIDVATAFFHSLYGPQFERHGINYDDKALIWNTYASVVGHGVGLWEEDGDTGLPPELEGKLDVIVKKDKKLVRLADQIQGECAGLKQDAGVEEKHLQARDYDSADDALAKVYEFLGAEFYTRDGDRITAYIPVDLVTGQAFDAVKLFKAHGLFHWPDDGFSRVKKMPDGARPTPHPTFDTSRRFRGEAPRGGGPLEEEARHRGGFVVSYVEAVPDPGAAWGYSYDTHTSWHRTEDAAVRSAQAVSTHQRSSIVYKVGRDRTMTSLVGFRNGKVDTSMADLRKGSPDAEDAAEGLEAGEANIQRDEPVRIRVKGAAGQTFETYTFRPVSPMTVTEIALQAAQTLQPGMIVEVAAGRLKWSYRVTRHAGLVSVERVAKENEGSEPLSAGAPRYRDPEVIQHKGFEIWSRYQPYSKETLWIVDYVDVGGARRQEKFETSAAAKAWIDRHAGSKYVQPYADESPQGGEPSAREGGELEYSGNLSKLEAERVQTRLLSDDKKLRKLGGKGNYSGVRVEFQTEMLGKKLYRVMVKPLEAREAGYRQLKPGYAFKARGKSKGPGSLGAERWKSIPDENWETVMLDRSDISGTELVGTRNIDGTEHAVFQVLGDAGLFFAQTVAYTGESPRVEQPSPRLAAAETPDAVPWVRITRDPKLYEEGIKRAKEIGPIENGKQIYELLSPALSEENQEVFLVVLCNLRQECIGVAEVHRGERSRVSVSRADIFQVVTKSGADHFHVVHNHPSGDPTPSPADRELTEAIMNGAEEVEIPCVDHVVIGMGKFYSFAEGEVTKVR